MSEKNWYEEGLSFKCQGCGKCCHGFPGYVWLNQKEILKISAYLSLSVDHFLKKYTRVAYGKISLKELKAPTYECIFYEKQRCTIYPVRPFQCRSYPFWPYNLQSKEEWEKNIKTCCPGSKCQEIHHSKEKIDSLLEEYKKELSF